MSSSWRFACFGIFVFLVLPTLLPSEALAGACTSGANTLCLQDDRFEVTIGWEDGGDQGQGLVTGPGSTSFDFFRYNDPLAAEVMVQVVNGCGVNSNYWVRLSSLSDYGQTITVTDLNLGGQVQYGLSEGVYSQPINDLSSFPCTAPSSDALQGERIEGTSELLLFDDRFSAEVTWEANGGATGSGQSTEILDRAGYFAFFTASPDMFVKMTPGAGSGFYSVVAGATTNSAYELTITDLCSGAVKVYNQPLNTTITIVDEMAFEATCPAIFTDDFETGGLLNWSGVVGEL